MPTKDNELKLNFQLKNLAKEDIPGDTAGQILAQALAAATEGDVSKLMSWAMKLQDLKVLTLDASDKQKLENFIKTTRTLTNLAKHQILEVIEKVKTD